MTKKPVGNAGKVYKKYTEEFRRDAVRMIETEGLTTAEVGRRLGANANLLRKWRHRSRQMGAMLFWTKTAFVGPK